MSTPSLPTALALPLETAAEPELIAEPVRRGRPRSEKSRTAILEAAAELLLDHGLGAVSMDAVAERAGVSKATIYRWWSTKETLALDALHQDLAAAAPDAEGCTGSLRADLLSLLRPWVGSLGRRPYGRVIAALLTKAQTDPWFAEEYRARIVRARRDEAAVLFRHAIEHGELPADTNIELALDLLYGPLYHRLLHAHAPLDDRCVGEVVDFLLGGLDWTPVHRSRSRSAHARERELRPFTVDDVLALQRQGAQILDTRDARDFHQAHLAGAVNIGLGGSYATWCGAVLDRDRPLVIVADPGREQEAAVRLGPSGFEVVEGYLEGGMAALGSSPDRLARVERVTAPALAEQLESSTPPVVLDVRSEREWHELRIGASINIPLTRITRRLDRLSSDRPLVVYCAEGYRSAIAASLLLQAGFSTVRDLAGGMAEWQSCELETVGTG